MKKILLTLTLLICVSSSLIAFAHSGRTDGSGGHNSSSGYHYHHGYSAHKHTNGKCPYDFDDQTDHSSGSSTTTYNLYSDDSGTEPDLAAIYAQEADKLKKEKQLLEKEIESLESELEEANKYKDKTEYYCIAIGILSVALIAVIIALVDLNKQWKQSLRNSERKLNECISELQQKKIELKNAHKDLAKQERTTDNSNFLSVTSVYIGTAVLDANHNALSSTYTEYVASRYKEKGYTVTVLSDSNKLEKYLKATKPGKCLLIQCVYSVSSLSLNEASVVALYSTYIRLNNNNYLSNTTPVLITNTLLTDEAKEFAEQLNITYKEKYNM